MTAARVWIHYHPNLYSEIFRELFQSTSLVEVVEQPPPEGEPRAVDVIVLSLEGHEQLTREAYSRVWPQAKFLAFSPDGDYGLKRLPGEERWEEVRPFGLAQLMDEVLAGSQLSLEL